MLFLSSLVKVNIVDVESTLIFFVSHEFSSKISWLLSGFNHVVLEDLYEFCDSVRLNFSFEDDMSELALLWDVHAFFLFLLLNYNNKLILILKY